VTPFWPFTDAPFSRDDPPEMLAPRVLPFRSQRSPLSKQDSPQFLSSAVFSQLSEIDFNAGSEGNRSITRRSSRSFFPRGVESISRRTLTSAPFSLIDCWISPFPLRSYLADDPEILSTAPGSRTSLLRDVRGIEFPGRDLLTPLFSSPRSGAS